MNSTITERLAVCSWSLQPASPEDLVSKLKETGIGRVQLALDPLRENPSVWGHAPKLLKANGITIVSGMFGCVGEDYSTLDSIRVTGGVAPDSTWEQNRKNIEASAGLSKELGLKLVTFHAGFLPHDAADPVFQKMLQRLREVAAIFERVQIALGFETGQETAPQLLQVLQQLKFQVICVNFDPANMILYDKGNPVEAVRVLGKYIRQVHVKDANRTKMPGTWGEEVPVGTGQVDWRAFFATLKELNFTGNLVIEREAGQQRVVDIRKARVLVEKLVA